MTENLVLWSLNKSVEIRAGPSEPVKKLATVNNHLFLLTSSNTLYKGLVEEDVNCKFVELNLIPNLTAIDIDSHNDCLYIVDCSGTVLVCNKDLTVLNEITLLDHFQCPSGHTVAGHKVKVKRLAVNQFGALYVSEHNQLWGSGNMPHIAISGDQPKKVEFFCQRIVHDIAMGSDFAVIVVSKQTCIPYQPESCQLCLPLENVMNELNNLPRVLSSEVIDNQPEEKQEKNIIFRNTEAAKEFLTRQISRMSTVGEEYLMECAEKPTRIIKENMTNVASFVCEGVNKVVRHVSLGSAENGANNSETIVKNSKEDFVLSLSQSTSENNLQDLETETNTEIILVKGSNILDREVWMWGGKSHQEGMFIALLLQTSNNYF